MFFLSNKIVAHGLALAILALALIALRPSFAVDEVPLLATYATASLKRDEVFPSAFQQALESRLASIVEVYPLGKPSEDRLRQALWVLDPDGTAFVLLPRAQGARSPDLSLSGSWKAAEGGLHLHVVGQGAHGLVLSLDGLLLKAPDGFELRAVFSVEVQGVRHAEWIEARLAKTENAQPDTSLANLLDLARRKRQIEEASPQHDRVLSEPTGYLGGVPLDTIFDVKISGRLDGVPFGPRQAMLFVDAPRRQDAPAPSLSLIAEGELGPGFGIWQTARIPPPQSDAIQQTAPDETVLVETVEPPSFQETPEPGVQVMAANSRVLVSISPVPPPRELYWWVPDPDQPDEGVSAFAETGSLDLKFDDDQVSGTLVAQGRLANGSHRETRLEAKIEGYIQASELLKTLKDSVGARRFSGRWQDDLLGTIAIRQQDKKITGSSDRDGAFAGAVDGSVADFASESASDGSQRGFLRVLSNGSLLGLTWDPANPAATTQPVLATSLAPGGGLASGTEDRFPDPKDDAEADAMKYLGYDYARAGKHRDAAEILSKTIRYYRQEAEKAAAEKRPRVETQYLLNQAIAIYTLIDSAFAAGDYPRLVEGLGFAVDLQGKLGQIDALPRALRAASERYEKRLRSTAETAGLLSEAVERGLGTLTAGGIGIGIEPSIEDQGLLVNAIAPAMPAAQAGIAVGDYVQSIDGMPVRDMTVEEAIGRLRGPAGSPVSLIVSRGGESRPVELTRAPLTRAAPERLTALSQTMTGLRDLSLLFQRELIAEAELVSALTASSNPKIAFDRLSEIMRDRLDTTGERMAEAINLAHKSLEGSPEALDLFVRFGDLMQEMGLAPNDPRVHALAMELDREIEQFKETSGVSSLDADLLELNGYLVSALSQLQMDLPRQSKLVEKGRNMAENTSGAREIQETARSLSQRLDRWRTRLISDSAKIEALDEGQSFYVEYVKLLIRLDLPEEALAASEAARARAFLDLLAERAMTDPSVPAAENAAARLASQTISDAPSVAEISTLIQEVNSTVLEYFVMDDALLAWVISPSHEDGVEQPTVTMRRILVDKKDVSREQLQAAIARLTDLLSNQGARETPADIDRVSVALRGLYKLLIEPVSDLLPDQPERSLIVVPHQDLFAVPFAALARPDTSEGERYLVQDHALVYVPSLGVLRQIHARANNRTRDEKPSLLAVVNPKFGPNLEDKTGKLPAPLPDLEVAMEHVLKFYVPRLVRTLTGADATLDRVLTESPSRDVVIFATHAEALTSPENSYIALADHRLRLADLDEHRLNARLAILAACETGSGPITSDGVEALARTIVAAGSDALIATLLEVPEEATGDLLYGFHRAWLRDGKSLAESLREAQIGLIKNYGGQIRLWAGFGLIGGVL